MNQFLPFSAFIFGASLLLAGCAAHPGPVLATDDSGSPISADNFSPRYEYAGDWIVDGDPNPATMTRHGKQITAVYNNSGYQHVFTGHYVNDTTIVGIQTRLKLADHTTTRMRLTDTFTSPDSIRVDWVGLDSNSDLAEGQTGVGFLRRAHASDTRMRDRPVATDTSITPPSTGDFSPKYDYAGNWLVDGDPNPAHTTRDGKHITGVYDNSGYMHTVVGDYVNATTIVAIQTRLKRADHTTTRMRLTYTFVSPNTMRVDWVSLDSNSDLAKGQTGVGFCSECNLPRNKPRPFNFLRPQKITV